MVIRLVLVIKNLIDRINNVFDNNKTPVVTVTNGKNRVLEVCSVIVADNQVSLIIIDDTIDLLGFGLAITKTGNNIFISNITKG